MLVVAGCREDAGELDERLFAAWAEQMMGQIAAAADGGDVREALRHLRAFEAP